MYTDASAEPDGLGSQTVALCWLVWSPTFKEGCVCEILVAALRSFDERESYIAIGEALVVLLVVHRCSASNTDILLFSDNLGVVSALCSGRRARWTLGCSCSSTCVARRRPCHYGPNTSIQTLISRTVARAKGLWIGMLMLQASLCCRSRFQLYGHVTSPRSHLMSGSECLMFRSDRV